MLRLLTIILFTVSILSCGSSSKTVKYAKPQDEIYANQNLKEFFKITQTPNIVLRVPNNNDKVTSNTTSSKDNNILYNTIEKELLKKGFSVRDRGLFNELLNKSQTTDYSKIKELTNTDLILEVVNIDPAVIYSTNKYTIQKRKKEIEQIGQIDYKKYGASVEYRIIMVKNNEIAGSYKYNYQPCPNGCEISSFKFSSKKSKLVVLKETVSINTLEEFIKICTLDLVRSFKG